MSRVRIVADSTCDLSKELLDRYEISIIPLCIVMGEDSRFDGLETTPEQIYAWADANKTTPKTAATTPAKAQEILAPFMEAGEDIIFLGISEQMSTNCNVVRLIGQEEEYERLFVIDSMNLSTGIGLQVIKAASMAQQGKTAEEIVKEIEGCRDRVRASFVVDTLTYLARGGRCTSATALLANTLRLHPQIIVRDGAMTVNKKYRGNLASAVLKYAMDQEPELLEAEPEHVFITHSGCSEDIIQSVYDYLKKLDYFKEIHITRAGGVISSHCGYGTLGVLYYVK